MLTVDKLSFSYGEVQALRDVSLKVPRGEIVCVMGRNGVGKTTLMKTIVGLLAPSAGSIAMDGADVSAAPAYDRVRTGIAFVPQGRMIFPKLRVEENLKIGLGARADRARRVPDFVYDLFPVLKQMKRRMGGDLSGGQQQQLAIARALVTDPRLLILDEPTEGIQPNIVQHIGEVLRQLVEERDMTILIVEQYLDFVHKFTNEFYVMNRGAIVVGDKTENLNDEIVRRYLSV